MRLSGVAMDEVNERGEPIVDDTLLVLLNAATDARRRSSCQAQHRTRRWTTLSSIPASSISPSRRAERGERYQLPGPLACVLLRADERTRSTVR